MTKILKGIIAVMSLCAVVLFLGTTAKAAEEDYEYTVENGEACITAYCGMDTDVVIPAELGGYPVTSIGDYAFYACMDILSISVPATVTDLGDYAFATCWSMTEIQLPTGLTSMGIGVFEYCLDLQSVTIPSGVTELPDNAFTMCGSLVDVELPATMTSIGAYAFEYCTALSEITIPASVTAIGTDAFINCDVLTAVEIPAAVTEIGEYAFGYSKSPSGDHALNEAFTITGVISSAAEEYATANDIIFVATGDIMKPVQVTGVHAVYEEGVVKLTWDDCGAKQYRVMRFDGITPGYTTLTFRATAEGYVDTDLIEAHRYFYRIVGYFEDINGDLASGSVSVAAAVVATDKEPGKVTTLTASVADGAVTLDWETSEGVRYYKVVRAPEFSGGYYRCLQYNVTDTTYTDTTAAPGQYRYKIVGYYKDVDGSWVYGGFSTAMFVTVE